MPRRLEGVGLLTLALLALGGCAPNGVQVVGNQGPDKSVTRVLGPVQLGARSESVVSFFNAGTARAKLVSATVSGTPVRIEGVVDEAAPIFVISGLEGAIDGRALRDARLFFDPPALTEETSYSSVVSFDFHSVDGDSSVFLSLEGTALPFTCGQEVTIDFGGVRIGESTHRRYGFLNQRSADDVVSFIGGADFGTDMKVDPEGPRTLAPGGALEVDLTFTPSQPGRSTRHAQVQRSASCPTFGVTLRGDGVTQSVTARAPLAPWTTVGSSSTVDVTLENHLREPVTLTPASPTAPFGFATTTIVLPPARRDPGTLAWEAGRATLPVTFSPTAEGPQKATLTLETELAWQPLVIVPLEGLGGELHAVFTPTEVTLPATTVGTASSGAVRLEAVGTSSPLDEAWLRVASTPTVTVVELGTADELCVGAFDANARDCRGLTSLQGLQGGMGTDVRLSVLPRSAGRRVFDVTFTSNASAPNQHVVRVVLEVAP